MRRGRPITFGRNGKANHWAPDEEGETPPTGPREMHPTAEHGRVRSLKGGDFTPEEVALFEKLYGRGPRK